MDRLLAPEIIEQIIDHIHDDKKSLFATSQTCKGMLLRSRFHLFSSLELTVAGSSGESQGRSSMDRQRLSAFLAILDAPYSSMGNAIQNLTINFAFKYPQKLPKDLARVRKNLSNVRTLQWRDDKWSDVPTEFKSMVFGLDLGQLITFMIRFQKSSEILQMISMWPSTLEWVEMGPLACSAEAIASDVDDDCNSALAGIPRERIYFQTLYSSTTWAARDVFRSLIRTDSINIFRLILGLHFPTVAEVQWVKELLSKYGPTLKEVLLLVPIPIASGLQNIFQFWNVCNLQDCTDLRVLHIRNVYLGLGCSMGNKDVLHVTTRAIQRMISSIPNPSSLEEIVIRFQIDLTEGDRPDSLDLAPFMAQFMRFNWGSFAEFLLGIDSSSDLPTLNRDSPSSASSHSSVIPSSPLPRQPRIHIELGAFPPTNALYDKVFVKNYDKYVQYIYESGLYLLERGRGESAGQVSWTNRSKAANDSLVISRVRGLNCFEIVQ